MLESKPGIEDTHIDQEKDERIGEAKRQLDEVVKWDWYSPPPEETEFRDVLDLLDAARAVGADPELVTSLELQAQDKTKAVIKEVESYLRLLDQGMDDTFYVTVDSKSKWPKPRSVVHSFDSFQRYSKKVDDHLALLESLSDDVSDNEIDRLFEQFDIVKRRQARYLLRAMSRTMAGCIHPDKMKFEYKVEINKNEAEKLIETSNLLLAEADKYELRLLRIREIIDVFSTHVMEILNLTDQIEEASSSLGFMNKYPHLFDQEKRQQGMHDFNNQLSELRGQQKSKIVEMVQSSRYPDAYGDMDL